MHRLIWPLAGILEGVGLVIAATHFHVMDPWLYVGLTGALGGLTTMNAAIISRRSRTLDDEFEVGYRIGFRAGRRVGTPVVVSMSEGRRLGRLSQTPVRSPSGNRAAAGRHAAYQD